MYTPPSSSSSSWADGRVRILYRWVRVVKFCVTYTLTDGTCRLVLVCRERGDMGVGKECVGVGERKGVGGIRPGYEREKTRREIAYVYRIL